MGKTVVRELYFFLQTMWFVYSESILSLSASHAWFGQQMEGYYIFFIHNKPLKIITFAYVYLAQFTLSKF